MATLSLVATLWFQYKFPSAVTFFCWWLLCLFQHFEDLVAGHFRERGHAILAACKYYMEGNKVVSVVPDEDDEDKDDEWDEEDEGDEDECDEENAHNKNNVFFFLSREAHIYFCKRVLPLEREKPETTVLLTLFFV